MQAVAPYFLTSHPQICSWFEIFKVKCGPTVKEQQNKTLYRTFFLYHPLFISNCIQNPLSVLVTASCLGGAFRDVLREAFILHMLLSNHRIQAHYISQLEKENTFYFRNSIEYKYIDKSHVAVKRIIS